MSIITKTISDYRIIKHRGFYTVERCYKTLLFGITLFKDWEKVREYRKDRKLRSYLSLYKHFQSIDTAQAFIKNEVKGKLSKAVQKGFKK